MRKVKLWAAEDGSPPYAGITLTRFAGMISDYPAFGETNTPERCKLKPFKSKAKNYCKNKEENN